LYATSGGSDRQPDATVLVAPRRGGFSTLRKVGTDSRLGAFPELEFCCGASRSKVSLPTGRNSKIGKVARYIGKVQAADADEAIRLAIEKYDIAPEQQAELRPGGS
jgi:hypothetical protein